jgi:uncharacterized protein
VVVGGTAWLFSRPDLQQEFDYLFVDEAGQFSLANAVAVGISAKNLILVGDQMQLSQPIQGSHPGESGMSALDYLLNGHATIPPEFLLNPNRLNVAVSRAKCMALVVGCPAIMTTRCQTLSQMELVNMFCRLADYSQNSLVAKSRSPK